MVTREVDAARRECLSRLAVLYGQLTAAEGLDEILTVGLRIDAAQEAADRLGIGWAYDEVSHGA